MRGWRERAADVFAEQDSIAAKMKFAPGPGPLLFRQASSSAASGRTARRSDSEVKYIVRMHK